jgi:hypothetical protein
MLQLGDIRVDVLSDGTFALDGGAMFGEQAGRNFLKEDAA